MMAQNKLKQILSDNGFSYHPHPDEGYDTLVIENIEISEIHSQITYIDVKIDPCYDIQIESYNYIFYIFINFKDNMIDTSNLYIDLSIYISGALGKWLKKCIYSENEFIKELHRLNSIGLNIKG